MLARSAAALALFALSAMKCHAQYYSAYKPGVVHEDTLWRIVTVDGTSRADADVVVMLTPYSIGFSSSCRYRLFILARTTDGVAVGEEVSFIGSSDGRCAGLNRKVVVALEESLPRLRYMDSGDEETLLLLDQDQNVLVALKRFLPTGLEFRQWYVTKYRHFDALVASSTPAWLFMAHGRISGTDGCLSYLAPAYGYEGDRLKIDGLGGFHTGPPCSPLRELESPRIRSALTGSFFVEAKYERTILRDQMGQIAVVLEPWPTVESLVSDLPVVSSEKGGVDGWPLPDAELGRLDLWLP